MLHRDSDAPDRLPLTDGAVTTAPIHTIIQAPHVSTTDDLPQTTVLRITDLDKLGVEEQHVRAVQRSLLGTPYELHDDTSGDVTMFVDIDRTFLVHAEEVQVAKPEHTEGLLSL